MHIIILDMMNEKWLKELSQDMWLRGVCTVHRYVEWVSAESASLKRPKKFLLSSDSS